MDNAVRAVGCPDTVGMFKINADGSGLAKLASSSLAEFAWTVDSQQIVYESGSGAFYAIDVDTGEETRLTNRIRAVNQLWFPWEEDYGPGQ